jgi:hypothetical protein
MKTTALLTRVADRTMRYAWTANGALDTQARAFGARQILARPNQAFFSEVDLRIAQSF